MGNCTVMIIDTDCTCSKNGQPVDDQSNGAVSVPEHPYYEDNDGDGVGGQELGLFCPGSAPEGSVTTDGDCDDTDAELTTDCTGAQDEEENDCEEGKVKHPVSGQCINEGERDYQDVDCGSDTNFKGNEVKGLLNSSGISSEVSNMRTSVGSSTNEMGMSIVKNNDGTFSSHNFNSGSNSNVEVETSSAGKNIVGGIHTHPPGNEEGPSATDLYHLINGYLGNSNYTTDIVIAANGKEYALVMDDPAKAAVFNSQYPSSSSLGSDNGFAHVEGEANMTGINSLGENYNSLLVTFVQMGYKVEDAHEQALVAMMSILNTGIKLMENDLEDDSFKELNMEIETDANGNVSDVKFTKCK